MRKWQRYVGAAALGALFLTSCRDSPVDANKSTPHVAVTATPPVDRKPSCNARSRGVLDAPLRHEKWASTVDVPMLKAAAAKLNERARRLDTELRYEILKQQDRVMLAERALATASDNLEFACEGLARAYVAFRDGAAPLRTRTDDRSRAVVHSSDAVMDVIECWSYDSDLFSQLQKVQREISALVKLDASSDAPLHTAITSLVRSNAELPAALSEKQSKLSEYEVASEQMAGVLAKAARVAGLSKSDRNVLSTAFSVLPKINLIVQQLDLIEREATATREKYVVDPVDIMCGTTKLHEALGRITEGGNVEAPVEAPNELRELWEQRFGAVHDVVDQALAVSGTEW